MVGLILYAYCLGERSSRQIEKKCAEDVAFRVLMANAIPDYSTISRFRAKHEEALRMCCSARGAGAARADAQGYDGERSEGTASILNSKRLVHAGCGKRKLARSEIHSELGFSKKIKAACGFIPKRI